MMMHNQSFGFDDTTNDDNGGGIKGRPVSAITVRTQENDNNNNMIMMTMSESNADIMSTTTRTRKNVLPLSMRMMRTLGAFSCTCKKCNNNSEDDNINMDIVLGNYCSPARAAPASPMVVAPMLLSKDEATQIPVIERILADYKSCCEFYGVSMNTGVVTTIRFSLPCLRVTTPSFCDDDMLALAEILLQYCNGPLQYIQRLDFSKRKLRDKGLTSHGALTLAKVLQISEHITEVRLERNRICSYGSSAIFIACSNNPIIHTLSMRRCRVGERGAFTFAAHVINNCNCGLRNVDISSNRIGYHGCIAIERAMQRRYKTSLPVLILDLEGNLVLQEIMNGVTHGLGALWALTSAFYMSAAVKNMSQRHVISCGVYSTSLVVLYISSTLYHSFFTMRNTKWIFEVMDRCAIYILIAGSYTPFLQIVLANEPLWSTYLLAFLWLLCILGIGVEFFYPTWKHKGMFGLSMYLGMGWCALICLPEVYRILPQQGFTNLMLLGGVAYTAGVPFFVRNNNLDHAIWHLFVLAGSVFHWLAIYIYVTPCKITEPAFV